MRSKNNNITICATAIVLSFATFAIAQAPNSDRSPDRYSKLVAKQQKVELPVRVVDSDGKPIAKAKVAPWTLRSSQGHGWWRKGDEKAEFGPADAFTDADGRANVVYPFYRDVKERIRTLQVSLIVDHPDFAYVNDLHIDVPLESTQPHVVKLPAGCPLEVCPTLNGKPADLDNLYVQWSDGRTWKNGAAPEKLADGSLRIPAMPPGKNSVLLAKLAGDRVTHFSAITDVELAAGEHKRIDVPLRPSVFVEGVLSDNVPRPVRNGRVKAWTLPPPKSDDNRADWFTWVRIRPDGTFTIDGWPADERLQLIALCDEYIATSGSAARRGGQSHRFESRRPEPPTVFNPTPGERIELAMTALSHCDATAVDEHEKHLAGVTVRSWPNVHWWNGGSQIYCHPLVRGERLLRRRDYDDVIDEAFPTRFEGKTDANGKVTLELPAGNEELAVFSDLYELPVFLGQRDFDVKLVPGETTEATLRLQPRGTEQLGEWDKLAGVVFGCSTREGRRICALPGVQQQMNEFVKRFREAKDPRDPQLLSEAYSAVADAFTGAGDLEEASKWRQKAAEQAAKIESDERSSGK